MSDESYKLILEQLEALYPHASGPVREAMARASTCFFVPKQHNNVVDIRTHAVTQRRARQ